MSGTQGGEGPSGGAAETDAAPSGSSGARRARETEVARRDFHRAVQNGERRAPRGAGRRSRALQAFFVANAGRGLAPSSETSGVLSPNLRTEEP